MTHELTGDAVGALVSDYEFRGFVMQFVRQNSMYKTVEHLSSSTYCGGWVCGWMRCGWMRPRGFHGSGR
jgi:hypothetical protein